MAVSLDCHNLTAIEQATMNGRRDYGSAKTIPHLAMLRFAMICIAHFLGSCVGRRGDSGGRTHGPTIV